ncbi:cobalamin biosynthesis protein [Aquibaculum sediminis]|uniref:cobalamin biosynthesis protein n=1 Tax=Aquibaculum sediminis TaxID=3231907 RepID=UPI0034536F6F
MAGDSVIAAGFGFRAAATSKSLSDAFARAGGRPPRAAGLTTTVLATAVDKAGTLAFRAFAGRFGLPVRGIDSATLAAQKTGTKSEASRAARGTDSVAEAAALAAAGAGARLLGPRVISSDGMATCALAEGEGL